MSPDDLLRTMAAGGVRIAVRGENLVVTGLIEELPIALVEQLRARKPEVLQYLRRRAAHWSAEDEDAGEDGVAAGYRASFGQARLAFLHHLEPTSAAYNIAASVRLRGACDIQTLKTSIAWLVDRHPALRTSLAAADGQFVAVVADRVTIDLPVVDLSAGSPEEIEVEIEALRRSTASAAFDLQAPPLWRCVVVCRGPEEVEIVAAVHHFVADGWSIARALRDVALVYSSARTGQRAALPPPRADYSDYAAWLRRYVDSPDGRSDLEWWRTSLAGADSPVALPTDHPRPNKLGDKGDRITFGLDAEASRTLRRFAADRRTTISTVISAVYATLLHRFSASSRFLVGIAVSDRPGAAFHDVFGFFVNWIPVLADFTGEPTFDAFLASWEQARFSAFQHQSTPFDLIARAAECEPDLSRHPLFQHMVVSHVPARRVHFGDLSVSLEPLATGTSKVDMTLFITDSAGAIPIEGSQEILLELEYSTALFERRRVHAFSQALIALLNSAIATPHLPVGSLSLLSAAAVERVHSIASGPPASNLSSPLLLINRRVRDTPDAPAIVHGDSVVRYGEFGSRAASIADALREAGVGHGDRVGVFLPRGPDLVAALVGVMMTGAAFLPLESNLPAIRLAEVLDDAEPAVTLTNAGLASALGSSGANRRLVLIEDIASSGSPAAGDGTDTNCHFDTAYLIYTSGSTGRPKGVFGAHRSLANFVEWLNVYLGCDAHDRVLCKTPIGFDASLREIIAPLCAGAAIVLAGDEAHLDPGALARMTTEHHITILHATPTIYHELLEAWRDGAPDRPSGRPALRHVMCGGETLGAALAAAHFAANPYARLHNVYGPTECAVDVTAYEVRRGDAGVPLGRPIPGAIVYVAGGDLSPLPPGAIGEIVIGGVPPGPGYWRRPDEQRERFVVPSGGPFAGQRLYRTGDLGRYSVDDLLFFEGRTDQQIKVLGARVELGEVERAMQLHGGVRAAAALLEADGERPAVFGFVQFAQSIQDPDAEAERLRNDLAARLPRYMRPAEIICVPELPHLPCGKTDRRALAALCRRSTRPDQSLSGDELIVATLMADLIGRPVASSGLDFFRAGGHSLSAARLIARLAKRTEVVITLRELFDHSTVAGLAALLAAKRLAAPAGAHRQSPIEPVVRPRGYRG